MPQLCFPSEMTSAEWAAWVQAIGSVVAIGAAFIALFVQHRLDARRALEAERAEADRTLRSAAYLGLFSADVVIQALAATKSGEEASAFIHGSNWRSRFAQAEESLNISFLEIPDPDVAQALLRIRGALRDAEAVLDVAARGPIEVRVVEYLVLKGTLENCRREVAEASERLTPLVDRNAAAGASASTSE